MYIIVNLKYYTKQRCQNVSPLLKKDFKSYKKVQYGVIQLIPFYIALYNVDERNGQSLRNSPNYNNS